MPVVDVPPLVNRSARKRDVLDDRSRVKFPGSTLFGGKPSEWIGKSWTDAAFDEDQGIRRNAECLVQVLFAFFVLSFFFFFFSYCVCSRD